MESTIVSLVSAAMVIITTLTMLLNSFNAAASMTDSLTIMEQRVSEIRHTEITAELPVVYTGGDMDLMVVNQGQIDLSQFSHWDILAQRQSGDVYHLEYTAAAPAGNQWTMSGIYLSENRSEIFDRNILNPGEQSKITINLNPAMVENEVVWLKVTTHNGVTAQLMVTQVPLP